MSARRLRTWDIDQIQRARIEILNDLLHGGCQFPRGLPEQTARVDNDFFLQDSAWDITELSMVGEQNK